MTSAPVNFWTGKPLTEQEKSNMLTQVALKYLHGMDIMCPSWMYDLLHDRIEELRKKWGPSKEEIPPFDPKPLPASFVLIPRELEGKAREAGFLPHPPSAA